MSDFILTSEELESLRETHSYLVTMVEVVRRRFTLYGGRLCLTATDLGEMENLERAAYECYWQSILEYERQHRLMQGHEIIRERQRDAMAKLAAVRAERKS